MIVRPAVLSVVLLFIAAPTFAQSHGGGASLPTAGRGIVDARFGAIEQALEQFGAGSPYFGGRGLPDDARTDGVAGLLRFRRQLTLGELDALHEAGIEWQRRDGNIVRVGAVYGAFVQFRALAALRAWPTLVFAEVGWRPVILRPLDVTGAEIGAIAARSNPNIATAGAGAVIGDIDSGVDVLHPHMFNADGGAFEWIDANADGVPTPGVDFIDYDRDGVGSFNEVLRVLDATIYNSGEELINDDGELDVDLDWLYVDANNDGVRNVGVAQGFTEFDPGYGEPVFVADDANRASGLQVDERVLLLKTSKVSRFVTTDHTFVRGQDLIASASVSFADDFFHGAAVASILVGGEPFRARSGIAPDADLVMYSAHMDSPGAGFNDNAQLAAIQDAAQTGVDVVVHEWTDPTTALIDGSGNIEEAMLNARAGGVVQVNPLGNLNESEKHVELALVAGVNSLKFNVGNGFVYGEEIFPYSTVYASLYWRGDESPTFRLRNPVGDSVTIGTDGSIVDIGPNHVQGAYSLSLRGTRQLSITIWADDQNQNVVEGDWTIEIETTTADTIVGRITDYWSGWAVGVKWTNPTVGHGTAVYPSTADAAFGVAAYAGRFTAEEVGQLRGYSGRGPRIDGARIADIAAPDDPFAAWGVSEEWVQFGAGRSWFTLFGGTSGAAPHVAGTVALMRAMEPSATPNDIEARLLMSARRDVMTGESLPDTGWGEGRLDSYAAVYGIAAPVNLAPRGELSVVGESVDAEFSDADGDDLTYRWDLDYDGTWETDWTADARVVLPEGDRVVRVEVRDGRGGASGAVLRIRTAVGEDMGADAGDVGLDVGPAPRLLPNDEPCGCATNGEGLTWTSLALVFGVLRQRRRR